MLTSHSAPAGEAFFSELREREFRRLALGNEAYLDYAGSALYADSQIRAHAALLATGLFGNPHSEHAASRASADATTAAKRRLLSFLDADPDVYVVCFTANTSAAIKLVAESYPFGPEAVCILTADNHNSVNGIREYARRAGSAVSYLPLDAELRLREPERRLAHHAAGAPGLLAFPAQSNFSGVQHPLSLVATAQALGLDVLLDVASFVPTHALSLRTCPADFVGLSFYKLFGYPTGLGALVARRSALARLTRPWFAGGTVRYASVQHDRHRLLDLADGFEDGTPHFLGITALEHGFQLLDEVTMPRLTAHVEALTKHLLEELSSLRHSNGRRLVQIHGPANLYDRGGTVAFNLVGRDGEVVPVREVESLASTANISVRCGCFCNPGSAETAFGLDRNSRTADCLRELDQDFSIERFRTCLGNDAVVGAIRASIGLANVVDDIDRAVAMVATFRD